MTETYSVKETIINQHKEFFSELPKGYKPKPKSKLRGREKAKPINVDQNLFNYDTEDHHLKTAGLKTKTLYDPNLMRFSLNLSPYEVFCHSIEEIAGGIKLPDNCDKPLRQYCKYSKKFKNYRNPHRSALKQIERNNVKSLQIDKKNITLEFK